MLSQQCKKKKHLDEQINILFYFISPAETGSTKQNKEAMADTCSKPAVKSNNFSIQLSINVVILKITASIKRFNGCFYTVTRSSEFRHCSVTFCGVK